MDFWPFYRLLYRRRGTILAIFLIAIALICAWLIFKFQSKTYRAEAYAEPRDTVAVLQNSGAIAENANQATSLAGQGLAQEFLQNRRIHRRAAELLVMEPKQREEVVSAILAQNGVFSAAEESITKDIAKDKTLDEKEREIRIKQSADAFQKDYLKDILASEDNYHSREGVSAIETNIRKDMIFEPIASLTSTEGNPQYLNRVMITALFPTEAEARLYANMLLVAFLENYSNQTDAQANIKIERLKERKVKYQKDADALAKRQTMVIQKIPGQMTDGTLLNKRLSEKEELLQATSRELESAQREIPILQKQYDSLSEATVIPRDDSEDANLVAARQRVATLESNYKQLKDQGFGEENAKVVETKAALRAEKQGLTTIKQAKAHMTAIKRRLLQNCYSASERWKT
jgi:hypothetical protein